MEAGRPGVRNSGQIGDTRYRVLENSIGVEE